MPLQSPHNTHYNPEGSYYLTQQSSNAASPASIHAAAGETATLTQIGGEPGTVHNLLVINTAAVPSSADLLTLTFNMPQFLLNLSNADGSNAFRFYLASNATDAVTSNAITYYDTPYVSSNQAPISITNQPLMYSVASNLPDILYLNVLAQGVPCAASIPAGSQFNYVALAQATTQF
jgi:hypothetical protein